MKQILTKQKVGDMLLLYLYDTNNEKIGLSMIPESLEEEITLEGNWTIESLIQLKLMKEPYSSGFSYGTTMSNPISVNDLTFREQFVEHNMDTKTIVTVLESQKVIAYHKVNYHESEKAISITTEIKNNSNNHIEIEKVSSFSICGWPIIGSGMRSWNRNGVQTMRYGQASGSQDKEYFSWGVIEDVKYEVCFGAIVNYDGVWQIDVYSYHDRYTIVGGLDDNLLPMEKTLQNGESYVTPEAILSVVDGDIEAIRNRIGKESQSTKYGTLILA